VNLDSAPANSAESPYTDHIGKQNSRIQRGKVHICLRNILYTLAPFAYGNSDVKNTFRRLYAKSVRSKSAILRASSQFAHVSISLQDSLKPRYQELVKIKRERERERERERDRERERERESGMLMKP
jgi:hypothetical protein